MVRLEKTQQLVMEPERSNALPQELREGSDRKVISGRYELLGLLGVGGMGSVYRARDRELEEIVALKVLRRELTRSPEVIARFRQEVRLARRVTHCNVARMYDIGDHEGEKYLTMEFIEGLSLATLLEREGPLALGTVVSMASFICAGLGAAHAAGVIHRDLKPENVMLAAHDRIVIADFGIARALEDRERVLHTIQGGQIGTPAYMAPEQVEGADEIDGRADIYALGAMLFELLTGDVPWSGSNALAVAVMRLRLPPPDPREQRPELPAAAAKLVMRCMARLPKDRFQSVDELASALSALTLTPRAAASRPALAAPRSRLPEPIKCGKSVAVIPFKNLGEGQDEYVVDGLTEYLTDRLTATAGLQVRPRGVMMRFKGEQRAPRQIGEDLGVQVAIHGTLRKTGLRLEVQVSVVSVTDGFQLWTRHFARTDGDVFAIGDEVTRVIADALIVNCKSTPRRIVDAVALDLYLRGRHHHQRFWREANARALDFMKQAHERAPDEPLFMAGYAMAMVRQFALEDCAHEAAAVARSLAERALELAPHVAEAHIALAGLGLNLGDATAAAGEIREALELAPAMGEAHDICGQLLIELGSLEQGIVSLQTAYALEPGLSHTQWRIARARALLGEWDRCDAMFEWVPDDEDGLNLYWLSRVRMSMWNRKTERAAAFRKALAVAPFFFRDFLLDISSMLETGVLPRTLLPMIDRWYERGTVRRRAFLAQMRAEVLAFAGHLEYAVLAIVQADCAALVDVAWLDHCPLLAPVRHDPRFIAVRERVNDRAAMALAALGG